MYYREKALLSSREVKILCCLAKGLTKIEVAGVIELSPHAVDYHVRNIKHRLGAKNIASAVAAAICNGIVDCDSLKESF